MWCHENDADEDRKAEVTLHEYREVIMALWALEKAMTAYHR